MNIFLTGASGKAGLVWACLALIGLAAALAEESTPGPGDVRDGYDRADYRTDSASLQSRKGMQADLLEVLSVPPLGLPVVPVPDDSPVTTEKVQLGRKLFFDRRLSANNTVSCAMCHIAEQGFTQNELRRPVGIEGKSVRRNAPTIYNTAYLERLFHDGRETSLENQVWSPLLAANEMGNVSIGQVIQRIENLDDYDARFRKVFGRGPDMQTIGMALASYERVLVSANSPFDQWYFGKEEEAMSTAAKRGFEIFRGKVAVLPATLSTRIMPFSLTAGFTTQVSVISRR